jgi:hypothetical protein
MSAPLRKGLRGRGSWGWDRSREEGQPRGGIQPRTADGKKYPNRKYGLNSVSASESNAVCLSPISEKHRSSPVGLTGL